MTISGAQFHAFMEDRDILPNEYSIFNTKTGLTEYTSEASKEIHIIIDKTQETEYAMAMLKSLSDFAFEGIPQPSMKALGIALDIKLYETEVHEGWHAGMQDDGFDISYVEEDENGNFKEGETKPYGDREFEKEAKGIGDKAGKQYKEVLDEKETNNK